MKHILLVEDTPHLAEEIEDVLKMEGYRVTVANQGMKAFELLVDLNPDLVVTDLLMPVMDGFELIQKIRSLPSFGSIPIIALSAKTSAEDKKRAKAVGADVFIQKPCKAHELVGCVKSLLGGLLGVYPDAP